MDTIQRLIETLWDRQPVPAHQALQELLRRSEASHEVAEYLEEFVPLLRESNSYYRVRGLSLLAANARWDTRGVLDSVMEEYLRCIQDPKPITARQCIGNLPAIARAKPQFRERILEALKNADTSGYADSMRGLVERDIQRALRTIEDTPF